MKKLLVVILTLLSINIFSQEIELKLLNEKLIKHYPVRSRVIYRSGLISTAVMESKRPIYDLSSYSNPIDDNFNYGEHKINYRYTYLYRSSEKPLIISLTGYQGDLDGNFTKLAKHFALDFKDYNVLVLETLTSLTAATRNGHHSLGGLHEAKLIVEALESFQELKNYNPKKVVLVSGSSSSYGAYYGSMLLNKKQRGLAGGLLMISGFNNMNPILNFVESLDFKETYVRTHKYGRIFKKAATSFFRNCLNEIPESFSEENIGKSYFDILKTSFEKYKKSNENLYEELTGKSVNFKNNYDYYKKISLCDNIDFVDFPMYWIHSIDDPMALYHEQYRTFHDCAKKMFLS